MTTEKKSIRFGRLRRAPENFVTQDLADQVYQHGMDETRRGFLRKSFVTALGAATAGGAVSQALAADGEKVILDKLPWQTTLGQPVAARPYGMPSQWEANLQRRESPGLTRVSAASVAFAPLQGFFGIITPNGLHFERHHQGWYDIDPAQHRLMINGMVKQEMVFTMDDLMRLPSVSRIS